MGKVAKKRAAPVRYDEDIADDTSGDYDERRATFDPNTFSGRDFGSKPANGPCRNCAPRSTVIGWT